MNIDTNVSFDYKIITRYDISCIEQETKTLLNDGWQKAGPMLYIDSKEIFIQEFVKVIQKEK